MNNLSITDKYVGFVDNTQKLYFSEKQHCKI